MTETTTDTTTNETTDTTPDTFTTPYELLGDAGIRRLAEAFYAIMDTLPEAACIRAMHAEDLGNVTRMLAAYLTQWMGGPPVYLALKGTVCLTSPHEPYRIGPKERDARQSYAMAF